jgi:hypothetical protein|tara:strand:+ start:1432 stop:1833 length:402 start_codon:yes stop_codon:yes gene_type:complete
MDTKEKKLLRSLGIYINPTMYKKYSHTHSNPGDWVRFYYYKDRKPFLVPTSNIRFDSEVTSTNSLHRNTFYKMTHLSKTDKYYDYYYKLKPEVDSCVIQKNKRLNKVDKATVDKFKLDPPPRNKDGKFIIKFE